MRAKKPQWLTRLACLICWAREFRPLARVVLLLFLSLLWCSSGCGPKSSQDQVTSMTKAGNFRIAASRAFCTRISAAENLPTSIFSVNVADVDGDGIEDLFCSQNFFGTASDISCDDNGRGLWLRGTGRGTFTPLDSN